MTLRELAQRLKKASANDVVRQIVADAGINEFTIYSPTQRWKETLNGLGLSELEGRATCITCYSTGSEIFGRIETALKKKYKAVISANADDLGFRKVFAAGNDPNQTPELVLCVNWYEGSREETKAMYGSSTDAANNTDTADTTEADLEIELEDTSDPFA